MKVMNVNPKDCIIIEDPFNGIKAAYTSNANVVMIPDLVLPNEEIAHMLHYKFYKLEDTLKIL